MNITGNGTQNNDHVTFTNVTNSNVNIGLGGGNDKVVLNQNSLNGTQMLLDGGEGTADKLIFNDEFVFQPNPELGYWSFTAGQNNQPHVLTGPNGQVIEFINFESIMANGQTFTSIDEFSQFICNLTLHESNGGD